MGRLLLLLPLLWVVSGCAALLGSVTGPLADDLSTAILQQNDVETVRDGAPAYLLMIDGLVEGSPDDRNLLLAGSQLYGSYASAFVEDPERAKRLADRSLDYGHRALCTADRPLCQATARPYDEFVPLLERVGSSDLDALYGFGAAWAGWIQVNSDDVSAIAELPKVEAVMERVVALDDEYDDGNAHLYLGVLYCQRPASLGGKPEEGRRHFERAIALSEGRNLMAQVYFARYYARLVFDRELHDQLLEEVLVADPEAPGLTLMNTLAQADARELLDGADDYF